jgi:hypothetical protein
MGNSMVNNTAGLKGTIRVFRRRPALLFAAAVTPLLRMLLILFLVGQVIRLILEPAAGAQTGPFDPIETWRSMGWTAKSGVILAFVFSASAPQAVAASGIALLTWEDCEGRALTARGMATAACRRLLPLILLGFIVGVGDLVGTLLLIFPGLIFLALAGFAIPAAAVESLGPLAALKRSFHLARGRVIKLVGVYLLATLVVGSARILLGLLLPTSLWLLMLALFFLTALTVGVFVAIALTLLYREARIEREGPALAGA